MSVEEFWNATPKETYLFTEGQVERDRRIGLFVAWHTAMFERRKRLPPLQKLLKGSKPAKKLTPEEVVEHKQHHEELLRRAGLL
jgi:hypothetical protein